MDKPIEVNAYGIRAAGMRWCVQLGFTAPVPPNDEGTYDSHEIAYVNLGWGLAKKLHRFLERAIQQYEATEGTVILPHSEEGPAIIGGKQEGHENA